MAGRYWIPTKRHVFEGMMGLIDTRRRESDCGEILFDKREKKDGHYHLWAHQNVKLRK